MGFEVVLLGVDNVELAKVEFSNINNSRKFAKTGLMAKGVKRTLILSFGEKYEGYMFNGDGNIVHCIF